MAIYKLRNVATEKYLNIAGSNLVGSKLDGQDVTIWTDSGTGEQMWITLQQCLCSELYEPRCCPQCAKN